MGGSRPAPAPTPPRKPEDVERQKLAARLRAQQPMRRPPTGVFRARQIDCRRLKCVALTFDDGPGEHTGRLLDMLAAYHAKATFFVVGEMIVPERWNLLLRMVTDGHELGNHTWDHPALTGLSRRGIEEELRRTAHAVHRATGMRMRLMRPPYGATDDRVREVTEREGLAQVLWDVDTFDWRDRRPEIVARRALRARAGSIVLLHDIHRSSVNAMPEILRDLTARGFTFVTVTELFGARPMLPGRRYPEP
ncbi:hypothetical protein Misp01_11910 [Microtetraspora sp. NBRC 13810]|uniref:polysaccharide deacetylase family protein n=1 Tax=Microtetraspora sp. NBRC 13810 TaxID=3030990 RepID=UPI0024A272BD|nr:polysaccharide deacetylase family protein [Microtetraspora sp. NBRC 13810]GLW06061.1 hypothetical protein Misp01_11910 [Microtetraspora sp. NBRC 13810]